MSKGTQRKDKPIKRPYATLYYTGSRTREPALTSQGFASTDKGAIRATVVRIFMGEYVRAVIYDRHLGIPIYTVELGEYGLQVQYGDSQYSKRKTK